ncbi:MAG: DnaJ domain-containing protein [Rhodospirillaceae bacterium]|nr:DnaJ domain-containing protein [Rhodospirillaceae bacterium]MXW90505.1 DnaJ domain-containing protein [Rhodospirillaceae bacterium]MYB15374.1 DnaJ domain-containing protein [Rhodospirillaceae bacterium]MYI49813.1 DnaJ domain-containing protein [Rhodospirillaceae bacterium]
MGWFLLGVALIAAAILLLFSLPQASVGQLVRLLRGLALTCAALFGLFGLFTGKLLWGVLGLGAALAIYFMGGSMPWNFKKPEKGVSEVETPWLKLQLDHSTGGITGDVLAGRYAGARIESLDRDDLMILLAECARDDAQSARLIEAYLDRMWPEWRNINRGGPGGAGPMDRAEALSVLGLDESATEEDIRRAHRELMRKHHPDQGGSDWLAAKLNEAREVLLGE